MSLQDHFKLKKDKFRMDPKSDDDAAVYFGHQGIEQRIKDRLLSDLAMRGIPKFFVYGRYGAGKTHTLAHIRYFLRNDQEALTDYPLTEPLITELPPLKSKDSWSKIHGHILDEIGRERVRDAASKVTALSPESDPAEAIKASGVLRFGDTSLKNSQAQILRALLFKGVQEAKAWEWLKGKTLSADDAATLGTETNLTEVPDHVAALLNIANLIFKGLGKKLVLLIDEGEVVDSIRNDDSRDEYIQGFRKLADDENDVLGFVIAFMSVGTAETHENLYTKEQVSTRLGGHEDAYIDLQELVQEPRDAQDFVLRVLDHLVDQKRAAELIREQGLDAEPHTFPFTEEAVDRIAEFVGQDPENKSPRQIIEIMKRAVGKAWTRRSQSPNTVMIDTEIIEEALYPAETPNE